MDVAAESGVELVSVFGNIEKNHLLESTGGGAAIADYDGDGDLDLYLTTAQTTEDWLAGRRPKANALYRNDGSGRFEEVAAAAGVAHAAWTAGAYFVDYDSDGDRDLFLTTWGPNVLYRNDGDGTFTDVTAAAGVAGGAGDWSASAAFGDLDGDGDLDLYVTNYCEYDLANPPYGGDKVLWRGFQTYRGPKGFVAQPDRLYENLGNGRFRDVSDSSGIAGSPPLYGLGVVFADLEEDGDLDIYVANDSRSNYLWRNDGDMRFSEIASFAGVATNEDAKEQAGMGIDAGDYDGDGRLDLVVTNFSHDWDTLYRNEGSLQFLDATFMAGLRDTYLDLAWGTKLFDFDNDGHLDLFVANGHIYPQVDEHPQLGLTYAQQNILLRNNGEGGFVDVSDVTGPGMALIEGSRAFAIEDLDFDGDLDLLIGNLDGPPNLLRNDGGNARSWVSVELVGTESPRDAVGARLTLEFAGRKLVREVNPYGSYQSQSAYAVHFGLGDHEDTAELTVRWPSGRVETISALPARRFLRVTEGQGSFQVLREGSGS